VKIAMALVVVAMVASACAGPDPSAGERRPDVPPPRGLEQSCPEVDAPIRYAEGDLREGARSVRLCPGPPIVAHDGTIYDVGIQPPEVLTTRVHELVRAVNDLEPVPDDYACPSDGGPRLTYWFSYPDGDARAVTFENFGCEHLLVGQEAQRAGGERIAQLFTQALLSQRRVTSPAKPVIEAPDCQGVHAQPGTVLPHDPVDLASASLCVEAGAYRVREAQVPTALLAKLEHGLLADEMSWDECMRPPRRTAVLLGYTEWRDVVRYVIDGCGRVLIPRTPGWLRRDERAYRLSPDLSAQLDALPLGPVVRFTPPTSTTTPPATPG
jgi:hypothetical protein